MAGANQTSIMRLPKPRELTDMETADSLKHWINQATVYIQRDTFMQPFLTRTWNAAARNRGQAAHGDIPAEDMSTYNELFLKHIASFLPNPFFKEKVLKRTTDINSVWTIFRENYNVDTCAESFLDLSTLEYKKTESYFTFYHRILYTIEQNLAPANTTVDQLTTPEGGDKLSVSIMDVAASWWLMKIDPRLPEVVKSAYSVQIKNRQRLSELVPQIAKSIPGILKRLDNFKKDVVNCLKDLSLTDAALTGEGMNASINALNSKRQNQRTKTRARGNGRSSTPYRNTRPICRHCNWIRSFLKISEVDPYHRTEECTRKMPENVRAILDNECPPDIQESDSEEVEDEENEGRPNKDIFKKIIRSTFQTRKAQQQQTRKAQQQQAQPPAKEAQDTKTGLKANANEQKLLSEKDLLQIKLRAINLSTKALSPRMLVTHDGTKSPMLIDEGEGAELNALDGDYAKKKNVRLAPSTRSASGAGSQNLVILGETRDDFFVTTKFQNTKVNINMGKVTVIKNLGTPLILGEPGKALNNIQTDPSSRMIHLVRQGQKLSKPYLDSINLDAPSICRISASSVTIFPDDSIDLPVPEHLANTDVFVTPRRGYEDYIKPGVVHTSSTVSLHNISMFPLNLKKHEQVADLRRADTVNPPDTNDYCPQDSINMVHPHSTDDFKFKPTVKERDPPAIDKIKIDPDNQLSPRIRQKFEDL